MGREQNGVVVKNLDRQVGGIAVEAPDDHESRLDARFDRREEMANRHAAPFIVESRPERHAVNVVDPFLAGLTRQRVPIPGHGMMNRPGDR